MRWNAFIHKPPRKIARRLFRFYTIKVDDTEVAVAGLKSAAYAEASSFEVAGAAKTAEDNAKQYVDTALTWGTF